MEDSSLSNGEAMIFSSDRKMRQAEVLAQQFYAKVLYDEEPAFVSDEATIWDISLASGDDLIERCKKAYGKDISLRDLSQPVWKLLQVLNENHES
jgi:hypothetical protein